MIVKFILLIIFVWLGIRIYQALKLKKQGKIILEKPEDMVRCEKCGLHVPVNEAIKHNNKLYCSPDHAHTEE